MYDNVGSQLFSLKIRLPTWPERPVMTPTIWLCVKASWTLPNERIPSFSICWVDKEKPCLWPLTMTLGPKKTLFYLRFGGYPHRMVPKVPSPSKTLGEWWESSHICMGPVVASDIFYPESSEDLTLKSRRKVKNMLILSTAPEVRRACLKKISRKTKRHMVFHMPGCAREHLFLRRGDYELPELLAMGRRVAAFAGAAPRSALGGGGE